VDQHGAVDRPLLAIESATARLEVALLWGGGRYLERAVDAPGHHAERILPLIASLLDAAGVGPDGPEAIAVSIGPGSFTSLRVGLATAKGLAFASGRSVVPVPTLEALAASALSPGDTLPIAALLDARRGEVYAAVFQPSPDGLEVLVPDGLFTPEALSDRLPRGCRVIGDGASVDVERFGKVSEDTRWPRAREVARLGRERLARGALPEGDLAPRYVRRAQAEVARTAEPVESQD
jgi:tRNA threonylcarbamoyladenosine biosynthesis protein TsaB